MPRALSGRLETRILTDGSVGFYVKIRNTRYALGREPEWTKERATRFLNATLLPAAKLEQPWWDLIPVPDPDGAPSGGVTFWQACDDWIDLRRMKSANPNTRSAAESPVVKHLLLFFAHKDAGRTVDRLVTEIDESLVRTFIEHKRGERDVLADVAEKLEEAGDEERLDFEALRVSEGCDLDVLELELLRRYGMQGGRYKLSDPQAHGTISLSTRGLSDGQINLCLSRLSSILDRASRKHGLRIGDPTVDLRLQGNKPNRNWLRPWHLEALSRVARALDDGAERYGHNGREAAIWVLGLCGLRADEFCGLTWQDLSAEGLTVRKSKSDAGERTVQVPRIAREALERHRERLGAPLADTPIWPTASGRRRDRRNLQVRLLAPVIEGARRELDGTAGEPLPPRVTPHTFRRTTVTNWCWLGRSQRNTMHEIGHKSSRLTLEVYAQAIPRDPQQKEMLAGWMAGVEL